MANQVEKTMQQKNKMENQIKEMEEKIKELQVKAQKETGKYLMDKWDIKDDLDSQLVCEVIDELADDAKSIIERKRNDNETGKSDM